MIQFLEYHELVNIVNILKAEFQDTALHDLIDRIKEHESDNIATCLIRYFYYFMKSDAVVNVEDRRKVSISVVIRVLIKNNIKVDNDNIKDYINAFDVIVKDIEKIEKGDSGSDIDVLIEIYSDMISTIID